MTDPDPSRRSPSTPADDAPRLDDADDTNEAPDTSSMSVSRRLLALQAVDLAADQLAHLRGRLPERVEFDARSAEMLAWEAERDRLRDRLGELDRAIESAESDNAVLAGDIARLETQLKTVIAPREAEALMHEIATITGRRDDLDLQEITALEEQSEVDDRLRAHLEREEALRSEYRQSEEVLTGRLSEIDRELAEYAHEGSELRDGVDEALIARYDRLRAQLGVAIGRLQGRRCAGCHLDLSAAEADDAKDAASATGITDCPHCGRMLVV